MELLAEFFVGCLLWVFGVLVMLSVTESMFRHASSVRLSPKKRSDYKERRLNFRALRLQPLEDRRLLSALLPLAMSTPVAFVSSKVPTSLLGYPAIPTDVAVADFNGDGKLDLATTLVEDTTHDATDTGVGMLLGDGHGGFAFAGTQLAWSGMNHYTCIATADFNRDGKADLVLGSSDNGDVEVFLGRGDGTFGPFYGGPAFRDTNMYNSCIRVGDFNNDGIPDFVVGNSAIWKPADPIKIYLGRGDGTFSISTLDSGGIGPVSIAVGDFNNDGNQDLAIANEDSQSFGPGNVSIFLGDGTGKFSRSATYGLGNSDPISLATGDFNRDGNLDLAVGSYAPFGNGNVTILLGNGKGQFSIGGSCAASVSAYSALAAADFNSDGALDVAAGNHILLGDGKGGLTLAAKIGSTTTQAIAVADFNGDHKPDLAVAGYQDCVEILTNTIGVDLTVTQTASTTVVLAGNGSGNLVYQFTVVNNGPFAASSVLLTSSVSLEPGITVDSVTGSGATTFRGSGGNGTWNVGSLAVGSSATLTLTLTVGANAAAGVGIIGDLVRVNSADQTLINASDDFASATTTVIAHSGATLTADPLNPGKTVLYVGGTAGNDTILFYPATGGPNVRVTINGKSYGTFNVTSRIETHGWEGNDVIAVDPRITIPAYLFGGSGNDILTAGGGNDVLVGGGGTDVLLGGAGRNLLIAGDGASRLYAGTPGVASSTNDGSILIAGSTLYDNNPAALYAIMQVWTSSGTYSQRIANLRSGSSSSGYKLDATTIRASTAVDQLFACLGCDWFWDLSGKSLKVGLRSGIKVN